MQPSTISDTQSPAGVIKACPIGYSAKEVLLRHAKRMSTQTHLRLIQKPIIPTLVTCGSIRHSLLVHLNKTTAASSTLTTFLHHNHTRRFHPRVLLCATGLQAFRLQWMIHTLGARPCAGAPHHMWVRCSPGQDDHDQSPISWMLSKVSLHELPHPRLRSALPWLRKSACKLTSIDDYQFSSDFPTHFQPFSRPLDKVTHWFRNSRAAQRRKQPGSGDEDDNDKQDIEGVSPQYSAAVSRSASRAGTPSLSIRSSSSSSSMMVMPKEQCREVQMRDMQHSNMPSEDDEYPEAITPENGQSPSPGPDVNRRPRSSALPDSQPPPHMLLGAPEPYPPQASYRPQFYPRPPLPYPAHFEHTLRVGTPSSKQSGHSSYDSRVPPGQFDAAIAIVSPYHSKPHPHLDEDPMSCAETAKRIGISLEDAYLLLDFHRQ